MVIEDDSSGGNNYDKCDIGSGNGAGMDDTMNILDEAINQSVQREIEILQKMEEENADDIGLEEDAIYVSTFYP